MDFDIEIVQGAGAFVCGESTALMASLEGKVGEPRAKYIHTVEYGYKNRPTNLNNVETWANVPLIINRGAEWFASMGTGDVSENPWNGSAAPRSSRWSARSTTPAWSRSRWASRCARSSSTSAAASRTDSKFKAVQTGGPSGGCLPE